MFSLLEHKPTMSAAYDVTVTVLAPTHSICLGLALNFSIFNGWPQPCMEDGGDGSRVVDSIFHDQ